MMVTKQMEDWAANEIRKRELQQKEQSKPAQSKKTAKFLAFRNINGVKSSSLDVISVDAIRRINRSREKVFIYAPRDLEGYDVITFESEAAAKTFVTQLLAWMDSNDMLITF